MAPLRDYLRVENVFKAVKHPRLAQEVLVRELRGDIDFVNILFDSQQEYERYAGEVRDSDFHRSINEQRAVAAGVEGEVRGASFHAGTIGNAHAVRVYAILRKLQPDVAVETGVCNGYSTAFFLKALEENGHGQLYSIDLPEFADEENDEVWDGKQGAIIPADKEPGWLVPEDLQHRWELRLGDSKEELPVLLDELGTVDFYHRDCEHRPTTIKQLCELAWEHLTPGGVILSEHTQMNDAFREFQGQYRKAGVPFDVSADLGGIKKRR